MAKRKDDGFFHLVPKQQKLVQKEKKKPKKCKEPKFKKGSWKHWLNKKLKNWKPCKFVKNFHFDKAENILIAMHSDPETMFFNTALDKHTIKELRKLAKDDIYVLINAYDQTYVKISMKSYLKLIEIDRMIISFRLRADNDGIEYVDVYENEFIISNINDLMQFINFHRQGIEGVYEIQSQCTCYTFYDYVIKIVVRKCDGSVETYKGDMNDFMKEYNLPVF